MSKERIGLGVAAVALAAAGLAAAWFLQGESHQAPAEAREILSPLPEPTPRPAPVAGTEPERVETTPPPLLAPPDAAGPASPESFQAALAGITGRVVDADGTPVADLPVTFLQMDLFQVLGDTATAFSDSPAPMEIEVDSVVTGTDGRFLLEGAYDFSIHALGIDLGGPRAQLHLVEKALCSAELTDLGDITLSPHVTFTGRVLDEDSQPVGGARVRAAVVPPIVFQLGVQHLRRDSQIVLAAGRQGLQCVVEIPEWIRAFEARLPIPTAMTQADGTFRLEGVPLGLVTCVADRAGLLAAVKGPTPSGKSGERSVGDLVLTRGRTLRGKVVDAAGDAFAGAEVIASVMLPMGDIAVGRSVVARDDGSFEVPGLPLTGGCVFAVRSHPALPWKITGPGDASEQTLELDTAAALTVHLVAASGELPAVVDLRLRPAVSPIGNDFPLMFLPYREFPSLPERREDDSLRITGLTPGKYQLIGRCEGFAVATLNVEVEPAGGEVTLVFSPARSLRVTVVGADDLPLEHARVSILASQQLAPTLAESRTGADGTALLEHLPASHGSLGLRVEHPAHGSHHELVSGAVDEFLVHLRPGGTLLGTLLENGGPPVKQHLVIVFEDVDYSDSFARVRPPHPRLVVTDAEGHFRVANLAPGDYEFEIIEHFLGGNVLERINPEFNPVEVEQGRFTIEPGATHELVLDIGIGLAAHLSGTIWYNGGPGADLAVSTRGESRRQRQRATTNATGQFELGPIPPGEIRLVVEERWSEENDSPATLHDEALELLPGEHQLLDLRLESMKIPVQVLDPAGLAVSEAQLYLAPANESGEFESYHPSVATTGDQGTAMLTVGKPGSYLLSCSHPGYERSPGQRVEIPAGGLDAPLVVTLRAGVLCAGRVELSGSVDSLGPTTPVFLLFWQTTPTEGAMGAIQINLFEGERHFETRELAAGSYQAIVFRDGANSKQISVEVPPGGSRDLVLRFVGEGDPE